MYLFCSNEQGGNYLSDSNTFLDTSSRDVPIRISTPWENREFLRTTMEKTRRSPAGPCRLTVGCQRLSVVLDRPGVDQHEGDHAGLVVAIDPVVDGAALHQHVAGAERDHLVVELHVDLAGQDNRVVDGIGAVVARRHPGRVLDHAENRA